MQRDDHDGKVLRIGVVFQGDEYHLEEVRLWMRMIRMIELERRNGLKRNRGRGIGRKLSDLRRKKVGYCCFQWRKMGFGA